ncbi:hypothetical protein ACH5RR_035442 [Cinchona calisaya]|uniref:SBP-type domain-containing protein n=1 Tax=Cinchona calisaya TaxID=153742 RepID=A0ABD2Y1E1_9GENT
MCPTGNMFPDVYECLISSWIAKSNSLSLCGCRPVIVEPGEAIVKKPVPSPGDDLSRTPSPLESSVVEGCNLDLSKAKDCHRKHRICDNHSKFPKVTVSGLEPRSCQQCSWFHSLEEFDGKGEAVAEGFLIIMLDAASLVN